MADSPDPKTVREIAPDAAVTAFLRAFRADPDDTAVESVGDRVLTVGHLRGLLAEVRALRTGAPRAWKQDWRDPISRFENFVNVTRNYDSDHLGGIMRGDNAEATITLGDLRAVLARLAELEAQPDEQLQDERDICSCGEPKLVCELRTQVDQLTAQIKSAQAERDGDVRAVARCQRAKAGPDAVPAMLALDARFADRIAALNPSDAAPREQPADADARLAQIRDRNRRLAQVPFDEHEHPGAACIPCELVRAVDDVSWLLKQLGQQQELPAGLRQQWGVQAEHSQSAFPARTQEVAEELAAMYSRVREPGCLPTPHHVVTRYESDWQRVTTDQQPEDGDHG